jgi:predicted MFS family arabinose efflux permease
MDESYSKWGILSILCLLYVFVGAYQIVPASVMPITRAELGVGPATASWIVSILFLAMAVAAIPVGVYTDRVDNRRLLGFGTGLLLISSVWGWQAATARTYWLILASRFLGGIAVTIIWTTSVNLSDFLFDDERATTAIAILSASPLLGFAIGQTTGPVLAAKFGWASTFLIFGIGAAAAYGGYVLLSQPGKNTTAAGTTPSGREFTAVLTNSAVWIVAVLAFILFSIHIFLNNWVPSFIVDTYSVSIQQSGLTTALLPFIGIFGRVTTGVVSNRLFDTRRKPVVFISMLVLVPVLLLIYGVGMRSVLYFGLIVAGFFSQHGLAILFTYVREIVPVNVAGTSLAVLNTVGFFGAFTAPTVTGMLIEYSESYYLAFIYVEILILLGLVALWFAPVSEISFHEAD